MAPDCTVTIDTAEADRQLAALDRQLAALKRRLDWRAAIEDARRVADYWGIADAARHDEP